MEQALVAPEKACLQALAKEVDRFLEEQGETFRRNGQRLMQWAYLTAAGKSAFRPLGSAVAQRGPAFYQRASIRKPNPSAPARVTSMSAAKERVSLGERWASMRAIAQLKREVESSWK